MAMFESEYELYHEVIEDVIKNLKDVFFDEGTDESVLQELKQIWKARLELSKAVDPPIKKPTPLVSNVHKPKNGLATQQQQQLLHQSATQSGTSATSNLIGIRLPGQQSVASNPLNLHHGQAAVSLQHANQQQVAVSGQRTANPPTHLLNQRNVVLSNNNNNMTAPGQMIIVQGSSNSSLIGQRFVLPHQQTQGIIGGQRLLGNIQLVNSSLGQQQIAGRPIVGQQQIISRPIAVQQIAGQQIIASQPMMTLYPVMGQQVPLQRLQHVQVMSQVPTRAQLQPNQLITIAQQPRLFPSQQAQILQVVRSPSPQNVLSQFQQVSGSNLTNIRLTGLSGLPGVTPATAAGARITLQMANQRPVLNSSSSLNNSTSSNGSASSSTTRQLRQLDGPSTVSDDENLDDDEDIANDNGLSDVSDDDPIPEEDEDIEAQYIQLTEEDDVEVTDPDELFDVDNLLVCLYDSVKKEKKKPKYTVHLKLGILSINGKDKVFKSACGEFQF